PPASSQSRQLRRPVPVRPARRRCRSPARRNRRTPSRPAGDGRRLCRSAPGSVMNSGATAERVHEVLKARIMGREFRPGDRLDPAVLAAPLSASVTPVRDALHLLTGEGLVETRTSGGFHVPALDEPALKDLYGWSAELLALAIRAWPRSMVGVAVPDS